MDVNIIIFLIQYFHCAHLAMTRKYCKVSLHANELATLKGHVNAAPY